MRAIRYKTYDMDIDLELRGPIVVLQGDSATGKSYIFELLKEMEETDNLYFINYDIASGSKNVDSIIEFVLKNQDMYVIIDHADELFSIHPDILDMVYKDMKNSYLIIGRDTGVATNISCIAELNICNNKATLNYLFPSVSKGGV